VKKIKIVSKWDNEKILVCGKYISVKDCLEKNKADLGDADLRYADLRHADLRGANLEGAYLRGANLRDAYLGGADLRDADLKYADLRYANLRDANLRGADLRDANLRDAYLGYADLRYANLRYAYLGDAKNYYNSHDFALEIIRRQKIKTFTQREWAIIGQITIFKPCWNTILKKYKKQGLSITRKLAKIGFDEYLKKLDEVSEKYG